MRCGHCCHTFKQTRIGQKTCSPDCALEYNKSNPEYAQNQIDKQWKKDRRVIKERLKSLSEMEKDARSAFQLWVRMRDAGRPCISCDCTESPVWDGGHFLKAELYSGMTFDPDNVHKQCRRCNHFLGGNELHYREGLIKRYGIDYVKALEEKKDGLRYYKFTRSELIEIKEKYQAKIKNKDFS